MEDDYLLTSGMELTHLLVVSDVRRAQEFYCEVLGTEIHRDYGENSVVLSLMGTWLQLVKSGVPTPHTPGVVLSVPRDPDAVSHVITLRVADCRAAYRVLQSRGAHFLTPPVASEWEVRCYFRDPDGHLLEINEARPDPRVHSAT